MSVCVIPARGNSKRLPGKNLLRFQGKPLVQIAAETALSAGCFSDIIISSEDPHILSLAKEISGVKVSKRPKKLSEDHIRADEVIRWEIKKYPLTAETLVCCLLPTTPLLSPDQLMEASKKYTEGVLFGVIPTAQTPFRSFELGSDGLTLKALFPDMLNLQSQDYPPAVVDAGQFYFADVKTWNKNFSITACLDAKGYVLDPKLAIDINYLEDWHNLLQNT